MTKKNRKWLGLTALMPAVAMVFTDQSVLPVALPTIQKYLKASNVELQWCVDSYLLVLAILVLAGGKVGDRIGHRKIFTLGMLVFASSSALCGLSPDVSWLIGARALQGVGAAMMFPASTAILMSLFPPGERGKATGINVSAGSLFLILGPLIGGYLTQHLSWRWIFWINLPIAVLGLILVFLFIPKSIKREQKLDGWGFFCFTISCSLLVIILMQGKDWGWTSLKVFSLFIFCCISTFFLFWREKKAKHPFLDLSLFKHPIYKAVNISLFATQFILMVTVYRAIFFQNVLDWLPVKTGVITVISSLPVLFMSTVGGWLSDRFGPKVPISIGFISLIFSFFWLAFFVQSALWMLFVGLVAFGIGIPMIFTPSYASAMGAIPKEKAGIAFGTLATVRYLSASLGVAVIATFTETVQSNTFQTLVQENPETKALNPSVLEEAVTHIQNAKEFLRSLAVEKLQIVLDYLQESQIDAFFYSHLAIGAALIIAFILVFTLYHRNSSHRLPEVPAAGWD